ncbi:MAG: futalosine hydrolase [Thermodesulfovibrionales bacterium]
MRFKKSGIKESSKPLVGLVSAVSIEGCILLKYLKNIKANLPRNLNLYKGKIQNKAVVYIISGIGKTNASIGTILLIEKFSPSIIINLGVAGAYPSSGLRIGDIVIAEKEIYGDEGIYLQNGFHTFEETGIPLLIKGKKKFFNEFPLHKRLIGKAVNILRTTFHDLPISVRSGPFLTTSASTGTTGKAEELEKRFNAICENMEGAAVAHVCNIYGIPMVEIRGISNLVKDRNKKEWNIKLASENCQKAVIEFLKNYNL